MELMITFWGSWIIYDSKDGEGPNMTIEPASHVLDTAIRFLVTLSVTCQRLLRRLDELSSNTASFCPRPWTASPPHDLYAPHASVLHEIVEGKELGRHTLSHAPESTTISST